MADEPGDAYDPSIVYHSHSSNLPHLTSWIDELVAITERGQAVADTPTTDNLVQALRRYDAAFRELLRQTSLFSEPVTKLLAKVWGGNLKLLDYMIKSYHRYVKHTSGLQKQAQLLVNEKQNQFVASKVREDEFELERTFLKARIRNLEAEIEAMKATKRGMDRENVHLRSILDAYVKSKEMNDPIWDILNEGHEGGGKSKHDQHHGSHQHLHKHRGGNHHDDDDEIQEDAANAAASHRFKLKDGVDAEREQLRMLNRLDIEMNETLTSVLREEDRQRLLVSSMINLLQANQEIFGVGGVVQGKWKSGRNSVVLKVDAGTQVDLKDEFGVVTDLIETPISEGFHIAAPFSANTKRVRGDNVPYQFREKMTVFPHVLRVPPAAWVCQNILSIYIDKHETDQANSGKRIKQTMAGHVHDYFNKMLGLTTAADAQVAQLLAACEVYMNKFRRIGLFASQLGLHEKEVPPALDIRDSDFILSIINSLSKLGELVPEKATKKKQSKNSVVIKPDVLRSAAVTTVQSVFEKWLPDGGHDYVLKVKAMPGTERGTKYIDIDDYIELMIEPWHTVRFTWEDHLAYMFHESCTVHRVLSEAQFANDGGMLDKDTIVSQLSKSSTADCARRRLRLFQKKESQDQNADESAAGMSKRASAPGKASNSAKEPVVELMNKKTFMNTMSIMNPSLRFDEVIRKIPHQASPPVNLQRFCNLFLSLSPPPDE